MYVSIHPFVVSVSPAYLDEVGVFRVVRVPEEDDDVGPHPHPESGTPPVVTRKPEGGFESFRSCRVSRVCI